MTLEEAQQNYKLQRFVFYSLIANATTIDEIQAIKDALYDIEPVLPAELDYRLANRALQLRLYRYEQTDAVFMQQIAEMQEKVQELTREIEAQ